MNELIEKEMKIENMIYEIRGVQVMLDSDLAKLYGCKNGTKEVNQAVKNNIKKFPERFSWRLSDNEYENLKSKFLTSNSNSNNYGGRRNNPRVFTEQGVAMLATIIKSDVAIEVSIKIMDAFVAMRRYVNTSILEQQYINELVIKNDKRIDILEETFKGFKTKNNEIYYSGQIYDAYSKILDIFNETKSELIIIDAYADKVVLDIISKLKVNVILIVKTKSLLSKMDIEKYNKQYNNLKIIYNDTYHDRYFILDRSKLYHCGTSINNIGKKTFSINVLDDEIIKSNFIKTVIKDI